MKDGNIIIDNNNINNNNNSINNNNSNNNNSEFTLKTHSVKECPIQYGEMDLKVKKVKKS